MFSNAKWAAALVVGLVAMSQDAQATIIWNFGTEYSGSGSTLSGAVIVTLDDGGTAGSVDVTINASGLNGSLSEYIAGLYLNLRPGLDPSALTWSTPGDNTNPKVVGVNSATDCCKADGGGYYDIEILWQTSNSGTGRFKAGKTDTITLFLDGLLETDFLFPSSPSGDNGTHVAALRARSLADGEGSGWFAPTGGFDPGDETLVPEPGSLALLGFGLAGLGVAARRRRTRNL